MTFHDEKVIYDLKIRCSAIIDHEKMHESLPDPPTLSVVACRAEAEHQLLANNVGEQLL